MTTENGGERIAYSAKNLFERIDTKLDQIDRKLDDLASVKADRRDIDGLDMRVRANENQLLIHEQIRMSMLPRFEDLARAVEAHVQTPHSAMAHHEDRIRILEDWKSGQTGGFALAKYAVPILLSLVNLVILITRIHP